MRHIVPSLLLLTLVSTPTAEGAAPSSDLDRCLEERRLPRLARVRGPDGRSVYGRVVAATDGLPTRVVPVADDALELAEVFERAGAGSAAWEIPADALSSRICAPVHLPQAAIDAEEQVVVAAGLNYAAHADEAGGGDVFLFPKPVAPTPPYGEVVPPEGVKLLDYEVELGFVLLADVRLEELPTRDELLAKSAFFVANEVTDREPIIRHKTLTGMGTGFVEGKGQPGFLPVGPWLVRGTELFGALSACGADGLGIRLAVDEGDGFHPRQEATTASMILDPLELLTKLGDEIEAEGLRTAMPVLRDGRPRFYPLAAAGSAGSPGLLLPAGSVVLTGTPEGVALQAPDPLPILARGLLRLRSPFEQFRREELERAASGEPGGYLEPGDRVRASIDGLGTQIVRIEASGAIPRPDPCDGP